MNKKLLISLSIAGLALAATCGYLALELKKASEQVSELQQELKLTQASLSFCEFESFNHGQAMEELQSELEECQSNSEDNQHNANNQTNQNWYLQSDNNDLEQRIRELEDELDDCQDRLRDCN